MPKTQSPSLSSTGRQEPAELEEYVNFKIGSSATIKSNHPIFPGVNCTITALPSPDAAIVELDSGLRERLLLKYLEPLLDLEPAQEFNANKLDASSIEISQNNLVEPTRCDRSNANNIEELTPDEERERHRLELKVERAFFEAGAALRQLRDKRLYRSSHKTFEAYCRDRFNYSRDAADLKIAAAKVYENLQQFLPTNGRQIPMPTNERQLRDLAKANLDPKTQAFVWLEGVDSAGNKLPSGRIIKGIVERLKEKPLHLANDFCTVGDVFTLVRLEGAERKYNGYPCVAVELNDFTIDVEVYDTMLAVKPENLKKIDAPDVRRQLPAIQKRIKQVRSVGQLDRGAEQLLKHLGRQIYLTDVEEGLLQWLENHYSV